MSFVNSYWFFSSNLDAIYFFFLTIAVTRTSNTMLNRSGESRHAGLVSNFKGKIFSFSLLCKTLAVGLSWMAFIMLRYIPSVPTMVRDFIMNGCWILSNAFSVSLKIIMWFLSFLSLRCTSHLLICKNWTILVTLEHIQFDHGMILFMYSWTQFAKILLRNFASIFIRDIYLLFFFNIAFGLGIQVMVAL